MAMLIMSVGLLGLLQSVNLAYDYRLRSRLREEALVVAEERMNEWRVMPFDNVTARDSVAVTRNVGGGGKSFTVSRQCEQFAPGSRRLAVAVRWEYRNESCEHEIFSVRNQ